MGRGHFCPSEYNVFALMFDSHVAQNALHRFDDLGTADHGTDIGSLVRFV